jgi:hypothetical protein
MFLFLILLDDRRIQIRIRIREARNYMDPTDPDSDLDPQHWLEFTDISGGVDPGADAPVSRHQGLHPHPDHLQEDLYSFLRGRQE